MHAVNGLFVVFTLIPCVLRSGRQWRVHSVPAIHALHLHTVTHSTLSLPFSFTLSAYIYWVIDWTSVLYRESERERVRFPLSNFAWSGRIIKKKMEHGGHGYRKLSSSGVSGTYTHCYILWYLLVASIIITSSVLFLFVKSVFWLISVLNLNRWRR